jgi:hypothetical protein
MSEIRIVRGDTRSYELLIDEDDEPLDLTTGDLSVIGKRRMSDSEPLFTKTVGDGIELDLLEPGRAVLTLSELDVATLPNEWNSVIFDTRFVEDDVPRTAFQSVLWVMPSIGAEES